MNLTGNLSYEVFINEPPPQDNGLLPNGEPKGGSPVASTLIYGREDAVLTDPGFTTDQARALGDWVASRGRNVTDIFITHGHGDHWFAARLLAERFGARVVATAGTPKVFFPGRRTLPKAAAFWILAVLFLMLFFASAAASPLYPVQFRFSAATLTAVFAVYVLVLLVTLLFFGTVSDRGTCQNDRAEQRLIGLGRNCQPKQADTPRSPVLVPGCPPFRDQCLWPAR